jgi:hypothetical protein
VPSLRILDLYDHSPIWFYGMDGMALFDTCNFTCSFPTVRLLPAIHSLIFVFRTRNVTAWVL